MTASAFFVGGLALANPLCLAPLAGVTAAPVREFFTRLGAALTHTEMVSCAGLVRANRKTSDMLETLPGEGPVILQLFGGEADTVVRGAEVALELKGARGGDAFAGLGLNMACPMPKVTRRGAGAALLNVPSEAFEMTRRVERLGLPVWVKIRRVSEGKNEDTLRFVEGLLDAGAENVCIHGRTAAQRYEGRSDRTVVAEAARRFPGRIAASGDVRTPEDVREYLDAGCAAVMLARGALANPWLFPESLRALELPIPDGFLDPSPGLRGAELSRLGERARALCGERLAVVLLKRLMGGMLRGMSGAAELRRRAGCASDLDALLEVFRAGMAVD